MLASRSGFFASFAILPGGFCGDEFGYVVQNLEPQKEPAQSIELTVKTKNSGAETASSDNLRG
jgi:hypothetical protein